MESSRVPVAPASHPCQPWPSSSLSFWVSEEDSHAYCWAESGPDFDNADSCSFRLRGEIGHIVKQSPFPSVQLT